MTDSQYNATLTIFFVSYAVFEPLTNVLLKRMRPSIFLPLIMVKYIAPCLRVRPNCLGCLGHRHVLYGSCTQLLRNDGLSILLRPRRSGAVPWRRYTPAPINQTYTNFWGKGQLLPQLLVQAVRVWHTCCYFLLCSSAGRLFRWSSCRRYRPDERSWRQARLGLDFVCQRRIVLSTSY